MTMLFGTPIKTKKEYNISGSVMHLGRYTIAEVEWNGAVHKGLKAIGMGRCSELDRPNDKTGELVAIGRALVALEKKVKGRKINHPFMG